ncbi:MAG: DUF1802 family protein, partial [Nostoc sp.]|uniref:DUF1802 family protein n=3 Tax=Nostoc TaxID=1177 RepID=UPI002FF94758
MPMELTTTFHALKEWAVAINALESGKTIMLLRKGGIHERNGHFQVAHKQILLYPTYEHQQAFMLKAEYANNVYPVTSGWHPETVRIGSWAEITDILPVSDESIVNSLVESMGDIIPRTSQLNLGVRLSPHPASDVLS